MCSTMVNGLKTRPPALMAYKKYTRLKTIISRTIYDMCQSWICLSLTQTLLSSMPFFEKKNVLPSF